MGKAATGLPALTALHLAMGERDKPGSAEVEALLEGPAFQRLTSLSLRGFDLTGTIGEVGACQALGSSALGCNLRVLDLSAQVGLLGGRLSALLRSLAENGGRLEQLILTSNYRAPARDEDWAVLLTSLRRLVLDECGVDAGFMESLVGASFFPTLRSLSLRRNGLDSAGLQPLLDHRGPCELVELDLEDNTRLDKAALAALAGWPRAAVLERLCLGGRTDLLTADLEGVPDGMRRAIMAAGWPD